MLNEDYDHARAELDRVASAFRELGIDAPTLLVLKTGPNTPEPTWFSDMGPVPVASLTRLADVLEKAVGEL